MTVQRATGVAGSSGGRGLPVGPDQPDPVVTELGGPQNPGGTGTPGAPDDPDPFAAGLAGTDQPEQ
jgi:hypothetical protein